VGVRIPWTLQSHLTPDLVGPLDTNCDGGWVILGVSHDAFVFECHFTRRVSIPRRLLRVFFCCGGVGIRLAYSPESNSFSSAPRTRVVSLPFPPDMQLLSKTLPTTASTIHRQACARFTPRDSCPEPRSPSTLQCALYFMLPGLFSLDYVSRAGFYRRSYGAPDRMAKLPSKLPI